LRDKYRLRKKKSIKNHKITYRKNMRQKFLRYFLTSTFLVGLLLVANTTYAAHSVSSNKWATTSTEVDVSGWPSEWISTLSAAMSEWNNAGANWRFTAGNTGHQFKALNLFELDGSLAFARVCINSDSPSCAYSYPSNPITDADAVVNTYYDWSTTGEPNKYDLQSTITHELGHWLQLNDLYGQSDYDNRLTMYGYNFGVGNTEKRTLELDDIQAIKQLCPFWTYEQTFNTLNNGDLNGQDSWSGAGEYDVQTSITHEGAKAVQVNALNTSKLISRTVPSFTSGQMYFSVRRDVNSTGKIYFTSYYDDSVGGDIDGNGFGFI